MGAMSIDSVGGQSYIDSNLLNIEFQAPEYAVIPWATAGRRRLTVQMALFCLCQMAASGNPNIDSCYPPLDSWIQQGRHRFIHNTSGFSSRRLPPNADVVDTDFEEDPYSYQEDPEAEFIDENRPAYNADFAGQKVPGDVHYVFNQNTQPSAQYEEDNATNATNATAVDPSLANQSCTTTNFEGQNQPTEIGDPSAVFETEAEEDVLEEVQGERKRRKRKHVKLRQRDNNSGYKFTWKGENIKTEITSAPRRHQ